MTPASNSYTLPKISDGAACIDDTWTATLQMRRVARAQHTAIWTGSEMIVWGGLPRHLKYRRQIQSRAPILGQSPARRVRPEARSGQTAVWTGTEMIVWGGYGFSGSFEHGRQIRSRTWIVGQLPTQRMRLLARNSHVAVWTGSEMIIWGGLGGSDYLNTGGRYNPTTNSWLATTSLTRPSSDSGTPRCGLAAK